jgi:hypothetical protein
MTTELRIGETYTFKWCLIKKHNLVYLYNDSFVNFDCKEDVAALVDVTVHMDDKGALHISGNELVWEFREDKTNVEFLNDKPAASYIKRTNGTSWLGIKPYDYVQGWYPLEETVPIKYILNFYTLGFKE